MWQIFIISILVIVIIMVVLFVLGYPRKRIPRVPSKEGLDDEEVANSYGKMSKTPFFKLLRKKIVSKVNEIEPTGILVDLGCGTGDLLILLSRRFPDLELVGIDIAREILDIASERIKKSGARNKIELKVGSAESIPLPDDSVDVLVSSLSLHHWGDPVKVFSEIRRVLKESGMVIIFDFRRDSRRFFHFFLKFITRVVVPKPLKKVKEPLGSLLSSYEPTEVIEFAEKAGFKNVQIKPFLAWMFVIGKNSD
ncbi:MAG: class I SAM-dependent methyltransferase [Candidatus Helarchaeales archaeon]